MTFVAPKTPTGKLFDLNRERQLKITIRKDGREALVARFAIAIWYESTAQVSEAMLGGGGK